MKYIDADKLKEKIEKKYLDAKEKARFAGETGTSSDCTKWDAVVLQYENVLRTISSLQQEQPEGLHFTPLNRLIQKIPSEKWNDSTNNYAKKLRDCLIKEGYLKDAEVLQGYISYMNGNNVPMATMDEQEQPKVDLVAELEHHFATTPKEQLDKEWKELEHWNNVGPTVQEFLYGKQPEVDLEEYIENEVKHYGLSLYEASYGTFSASQIDRIIRNAFELGLNARKEESK